MKALVRVRVTRRPNSGDEIGLRLQVCIPNLAARKMVKTSKGFAATETQVPAFTKQYLIHEAGDCTICTPGDLERFEKRLAWFGYTEFEMMTDMSGRKIEAPADGAIAQKVKTFQEMVAEARKQAGQPALEAALW